MTGKFNMDDYVDVAERIRQFYERHPEGSLQSGAAPQVIEIGGRSFIAYHAVAYRTADDSRPAHGWAWEPVPGPTQFTKDSELMNAETAAWGRAIVALGFETKKIASANEIRNRQPVETTPDSASTAQNARLHALISELAGQRGVPREQVQTALKNALGLESMSNLSKENAKKADTILKDWSQKLGATA